MVTLLQLKICLFRYLDVFTKRDALVGRTAKMFNVAQGFDSQKVFLLNPLTDETRLQGGNFNLSSFILSYIWSK